ncbi:MAG TPA: hypothetical protein VK907_09295 [Phnomibacter sp.]|nr:hypothetical protein [Phnomibacter sp.]
MIERLKDAGFLRLLVFFMLTSAAILIFKEQLSENNITPMVVAVGNLIIFLASCLTLAMYGKAKRSKSGHGFTRNVYAAFVIKFFILITAAMLYFYFSREISSKAVFVCLGLYLVYHFLGASFAARVEKKTVAKKH